MHIFPESEPANFHLIDAVDVEFRQKMHVVVDVGLVALELSAHHFTTQ